MDVMKFPDEAVPAGVLPRRAQVGALSVSLGSYDTFLESIIDAARRGESRTACFANAHMTVEALQNPDYAAQVNGADWVCPDGTPVSWAIRLLHGIKQERACGPDMMGSLIARAEEEGLPVFFYGSEEAVLEQLHRKCSILFPKLQIAGTYAPPFRTLTPEEEARIIKQITLSGAKLVFVALGCPKQERWIAQMRGRIPAVLLGIGGAVPMLAGVQKRAPRWMQKSGTEWIYRLAQEPGRLLKRYVVTNTLFVASLCRQLVLQRT